jgi:fimbrial isopeptide formation D2 family protein/LPXTG-motif cell wall-anchored protein
MNQDRNILMNSKQIEEEHMNKIIKSICALFVSLFMVLGMGVTALAEDTTYTITINNSATGHTYQAYQVFAGDLADGVLSNITWGTGVNQTGLITALKADTNFSSLSETATAADVASALTQDNASAFAQIIGQHLSSTVAGTSTEGTGSYTISGLSAGYYLVKDSADSQTDKDDAYTGFILKVAGNVEANPKSSVPTVEKKVQENTKTVTYSQTDTENYVGNQYNDVADYNIGDAVPFELIGTMPSNYADYTSYKYAFHDTASAGLTINSDSIHVYNNGTEIATADYTATVDGQNLTVTFANTKNIADINADSIITVKYTATLNSSAVIGLDGNPNEVYLTFSNNPNQGGTGDTGKTPTDKVIVFTYELDTTKVDATNTDTKLSGAEFQLYKKVSDVKTYAKVANGKVTGWTTTESEATTLTSDSNGLFKVAGLDDGTYYLHESKAPAGYNTLANDVELTIAATTVNDQNWTSGTASDALTALKITAGGATTDGTLSTGTVSATVTNSKGATLPSTGGIGTTIFYVVGTALIVVAGVMLVVRKRMADRN